MDAVNIEEKTYHHGDLKRALLDAAFKVLDREGVEALTIRRLARDVGVAHSAPANHFASRKALLTGLANECFQSLFDAQSLALTTQGESENGLIELWALYHATLQFGLRYPHRYRMMFRWEMLEEDDESLKAGMDQLYERLMTCLAKMRRPEEDRVSDESRAIALWSLLHGYLVMRIEGTLVGSRLDEVSGQPREDAILELLLGPMA